MPVRMVKAAVNEAMPPTDSDRAMATGVVVDFGARDSASWSVPPSNFVTAIAATTAVTEPTSAPTLARRAHSLPSLGRPVALEMLRQPKGAGSRSGSDQQDRQPACPAI